MLKWILFRHFINQLLKQQLFSSLLRFKATLLLSPYMKSKTWHIGYISNESFHSICHHRLGPMGAIDAQVSNSAGKLPTPTTSIYLKLVSKPFEEAQIIRDAHLSNRSGEYCETGLRIGDLAPTNHATDPGTQRQTKQDLRVKEGKTEKIRDMYIANCFQEVCCYAKNVQSPYYLFPSRKVGLTQAYRQLNQAAEFAGVQYVRNHTL